MSFRLLPRVTRAFSTEFHKKQIPDLKALLETNPKYAIALAESLDEESRRRLGLMASAKELRRPDSLRDLDLDGDGRISRKEFRSWYINRGEIKGLISRLEGNKKEESKKEKKKSVFEKIKDELSEGQDKEIHRVAAPLTWLQRRQVFFRGFVPMFGFGFLNNCVMLIMGDYIDRHIGAIFHISVLAAAALGNVVSDVTGYGFGKVLSAYSGSSEVNLTREQRESRNVKLINHVGGACGLLVGCITGMVPLVTLF